MSSSTTQVDRRVFLKTGLAGATGLVLGFYLPGASTALADATAAPAAAAVLNAWVRVAPDDIVTIIISKSEMGQGVMTSLSMLAVEELECDWKNVRTEFAPADKVYIDPVFGMQGTGGSQSIHSGWEPMRRAGATAREMLIAAAAQKWGVAASECHAENGAVLHAATNRRATFGSLAEAASKLPVPADVKLKDPSQFRLIGKPTQRLDTPIKVNGRAGFGIDVRRPGMLHAVVLRCPVFGGKVASFDATKAKAVPGVKDVVQISSGIAVVADNTWNAMQGRNALAVKWDEGPNAALSSDTIRKQFGRKVKAADLNVNAVKAGRDYAAATLVKADPFAIERMDKNQGKIIIDGNSAFGRRGVSDFVGDAVETSKAMKAPVQVTWSREDDMQHDYYRPTSYIHLSAGLGADGWPVAFTARIACDSVMSWFFPGTITNGLDTSSTEGVSDIAYDIPNILVDYQLVKSPIPLGFWRSVGASQNGFFSESFIDELAAAAKKDPYEFRRHLLAKSPRHLAVLNLAAEKAGWGNPLPKGVYRGIAMLRSFSTYVAEVAEVAVDSSKGRLKVQRVVCAVDCGRPVNPAVIEQQVMGAVIYGLTAGLKSEITIDKGRVVQTNFDDNPVVRMNEAPVVEVHIIQSTEGPTGMGEPAVPPVTPAVCNAIFAATGKRIRRLPVRTQDWT
ncbi:MAG: xanthine dehydrogenase family protein molybdopterin-binding subunit [Acidobacteriia bacterium]|nr:xanthine dehydrogenase family protein molybdopterin-binding subunit [Terriglobia bacterium]